MLIFLYSIYVQKKFTINYNLTFAYIKIKILLNNNVLQWQKVIKFIKKILKLLKLLNEVVYEL